VLSATAMPCGWKKVALAASPSLVPSAPLPAMVFHGPYSASAGLFFVAALSLLLYVSITQTVQVSADTQKSSGPSTHRQFLLVPFGNLASGPKNASVELTPQPVSERTMVSAGERPRGKDLMQPLWLSRTKRRSVEAVFETSPCIVTACTRAGRLNSVSFASPSL
jgi:hypothetical protein